MIEINKDNLNQFLTTYENFHDALIRNINYDIIKCIIVIDINAYNNGKKHLKLVFDNVTKYLNYEMFNWDFITEAYIKYVKVKNKEYICFADDLNKPNTYILCDKMFYDIFDLDDKNE